MIDPALYPFFSTLRASSEIKTVSAEKKMISWLLQLEKPSDDYILSSLRLHREASPEKIQKRQKIALIYAKILASHVPNDKGKVHSTFNYYQLVYLVGKVIKKHICKNENLFLSGILVSVEGKQFAAKVERDRVYLFARSGTALGQGAYGKVSEIYEIVNQQKLALKQSFQTTEGLNALSREVCRLNKIHSEAGVLSLEGLQDCPLAVFNIHQGEQFFGFIGPKYGIELRKWIEGNHENAKRLAMCKSLMRAFKHKTELDLWHGDLKAQNILIQDEGCVIIDWAGSISFQEALTHARWPKIFTSHNITDRDYDRLVVVTRAIKLLDDCSIEKQERIRVFSEFVAIAHSMELFAMAIVMFVTLIPVDPFKVLSHEGRYFFAFEDGIDVPSLKKLIDKNYGMQVVETITKMLSPRYEDRYSVQEAIDIWERI